MVISECAIQTILMQPWEEQAMQTYSLCKDLKPAIRMACRTDIHCLHLARDEIGVAEQATTWTHKA